MLRRCWFSWFSLCMAHTTYRFRNQSFIRVFSLERLHPIDKIWLVVIICLFIIISYYHLISLDEKNRDSYLLAASQWLCKYICKTSIHFVTIPSNLLKHRLAVHVHMSEHVILELVNSVSNSFEYDNILLLTYYTRYLSYILF